MADTSLKSPAFFTTAELADFLTISIRTMYRMIADKEIRSRWIRATYRFYPKDIKAYLAQEGGDPESGEEPYQRHLEAYLQRKAEAEIANAEARE